MRIAIDYTAAARQRAGIGRYTRGLIEALARLDTTNEYALFVPADARYIERGPDGERRPSFPPNFRLRRAFFSERTLARMWQRLAVPLPVEMVTGACEILYSPDFVLPPTRARKKMLTIHDLSFRRVPETAVPRLKWYLEGAVPRAIARADLLLADSDCTRRDLIELFDVPPERVRTLYSGVESLFCPVADASQVARVRAEYRIERDYVLTVGTLEPRKNLTRLVEAFARLGEPELELLVVGGQGWLFSEILDAPARYGIADRVRFLGFVPDRSLAALYSRARAFVYPSLYEGFGLPVLEALACGAPVVASNTSSIPEVAGEAALLVDPRDTDALAGAMKRVLGDAALRDDLARQGLKQARKFSWDSSAHQLRDLLLE